MLNQLKNRIIGKTYDEERALYHLTDAEVRGCTFAGPADGESALKEARSVTVEDCRFSLRYPLWHTDGFVLRASTMDTLTRAPIWYASDGVIADCTIDGVKCLRECSGISIAGSRIHSPEFGWRCRSLRIEDTEIESEYCLFEARDVEIDRLRMKGKYSFQYTENTVVRDSVLDTKYAFWHCRNVTVRGCTIRGEYLAWYSDGLTLIDCHIIGTQPLCYCKNLTLIRCTMQDTDLAFEYSDVQADVTGTILSVKNPRSGRITADGYGSIILENSVVENTCEIVTRQ